MTRTKTRRPTSYVAQIWHAKSEQDAKRRVRRALGEAAKFVLTFLVGMVLAVAAPWVIALCGAHTLTGGGR